MPIVSNSDDNFIHGLSDFWPIFFKDTQRIEGAYAAQQIQYGQLYLDLLDVTLGSSLEHVPLFSKRYFQDLYVREDRLTFIEGGSPSEDRWLFVPPQVVADVPSMMNRVLAPTQIAEKHRDYDVHDGAIFFRQDPFDTAAFVAFPIRSLDVAVPACLTGTWTDVKTGDTLRLALPGATPKYARVNGVRGAKLLLDSVEPEFRTAASVAVATAKLSVLRTPFDAQKAGVQLSVEVASVTPLTVTPIGGTANLTVPGATGSWAGAFLAVTDPTVPTNSGFHRVNSAGAGVVSVNMPGTFTTSSTFTAYLVRFSTDPAYPAYAQLPHTYIRADTFRLFGRRYVDGHALVEGVDYKVDLDLGRVYFLTAWDPLGGVTAQYTWDLCVSETTVTATTIPFTFDEVHEVRELAIWAPDVLIDRDVLYRNFGYLVGFRRTTSEAYRAFLKGVSALYLLGASADRFTSALNVLVGYPVVRETGETLTAYDDGVYVDSDTAGAGRITDTASGRDGTLLNGSSHFTSPTAGFLPDDIGAAIEVRVNGAVSRYIVTAIVSSSVVSVTPTPDDATDVIWAYSHVVVSKRFSISSSVFSFSADDIGADIVLEDRLNSCNNVRCRIVEVENPSAVRLGSEWPLADANINTWRLTRTREQRVTTNKRQYVFPFDVPMRAEVVDPASIGTLTFNAFEALTDAFAISSEQIDPTWWHHVAIPPSILELGTEDAARRYVTSALVEHKFGSPDSASYGDVDLFYGLDDEGRPGIPRQGDVLWAGGDWVVLNLPAGTPGPTHSDLGQYLTITTPNFGGHFEIDRINPDGVTMRLKRFPPPEARSFTPPVLLSGSLPDLIFRRTVAFVMFDRFLKRHALSITIDRKALASAEFLTEITTLVNEAKPTHTHVYLEAVNKYDEGISLGETFGVSVRPRMTEVLPVPDTRLTYGTDSPVLYGDAFLYVDQDFSIVYAGGASLVTLSPTPPYAGPYRYTWVNWRFIGAQITVGGHTRDLAEGVDFFFHRDSDKIEFIQGNAGTITFRTTLCFLRSRGPLDALLPYETRLAFSGQDPTRGIGLVDRPIAIRIT